MRCPRVSAIASSRMLKRAASLFGSSGLSGLSGVSSYPDLSTRQTKETRLVPDLRTIETLACRNSFFHSLLTLLRVFTRRVIIRPMYQEGERGRPVAAMPGERVWRCR